LIIVIVLGQGMCGDHIPRHQYFVLFDARPVANYYSENSEGAKNEWFFHWLSCNAACLV